MKIVVEDYVYRVEIDEEANSIPIVIGQMKGDIIVFRGPGDPVRLPAGTNGQVLVADSTAECGVKWETM